MSAVVSMVDEHFPSQALEDDPAYVTPTELEWFRLQEHHRQAMDEVSKAAGINIHGKHYTTVATRLEIFRKHFGLLGRLRIAGFQETGDRLQMIAVVEVMVGGQWIEVAQGRASETRGSSAITKTSADEVCETSAYGRALAALGLHGGEFASANEVEVAISQQKGDRSGRPDTSGVDPIAAKEFAAMFTETLQAADNLGIYALQDKLKGQPEFYTAVWDLLPSKQRTDLRKIISERPK